MPTRAPSLDPSVSAPPSVLIAAGPTHEPIDEVRYVANRSSGRLGIALAQAAMQRSAPTTLLLGPVALETPTQDPIYSQTDLANADPEQAPDSPLVVRRFRSSRDLESLLLQEAPDCDVLIMAAAVADFRPARVHSGKLPRTGDALTLTLEPVPDLLAMVTPKLKPSSVAIGFALEDDVASQERALAKMARKGCHAIVLNPLATMDSAGIDATILFADGSPALAPGRLSKEDFAQRLIDVALGLWATARGDTS